MRSLLEGRIPRARNRGSYRRPAVLSAAAVLLAALLVVGVAAASDAAQNRAPKRLKAFRAGESDVQPMPESQALREKLARGYLTRDGAATHDQAKAAAAAATRGDAAGPVDGPLASSVDRSWEGTLDPNVTPPDTTGAIGTTRYVQLINRQMAIYDRVNNAAIDTATLTEFTEASGTPSLADPQVIWDPDTARFHYVVANFTTSTLMYGYSKTDSPNNDSSADWCKYDLDFGYGTDIPDYPKLGTTDDFLLIGTNAFDASDLYLGSDILWLSKPAAGTTCTAPVDIDMGAVFSVLNQDGSLAFTPVPAVQTDPSPTGYVISVTEDITDTELTRFQITKSGSNAVVQTPGTSITVPSYTIPPNAPQSGTAKVMDTLDGRNTQAVSGFDPARGKTSGPGVLWTQHTVAGGAGSEVRWYEIDPAAATVVQSGSVTGGGLYAFNGAIAPDRRVNGSGRAFGSAMALVYNTSSSSTFTAIRSVTKTAWDAQSGSTVIKQSAGKNEDFSCVGGDNDCRWGDYSGASSDPASSLAGAHGAVWFANQWNVTSATTNDVDWRTWLGSIRIDRSYGFLRVTSSPALPSQIVVDGNIMDNWGLVWVKVPVGSHTVSFTDVEGYTTPADQVVNVTEGNTTTVTGTFTQRGLLRVLTSPPEPGTITIDGVRRNDWGVWSWFPTGAHQVCYGNVVDWLPPACDNVNLTAGAQTTVTGTYTSSAGAPGEPGSFGLLRATTSPALPSQIVVNTVLMDNWGLSWVKQGAGLKTVSFTDVEGYTTPADQVVAVNNGATTNVTGTFVQRGLLRVLTSPAVPGTIYVDGIARNDWGLWTWFPTGAHTVCFDSATGFTPPACQNVNLTAGNQTTITGTFTANS